MQFVFKNKYENTNYIIMETFAMMLYATPCIAPQCMFH